MIDTWIDDWLGAPRFQRYINACEGDRERAFALYAWNLDLSLALMRDIAAFEVALRNSYDKAISTYWDSSRHWLVDFESPFLQTMMVVQKGKLIDQSYLVRRDIILAVERAGGASVEPGKIVAELSFGFWTRLTETRYEKSFWVPYLSHAFPKGTQRAVLHNHLRNIRLVRNRIAHHEPIFDYRAKHSELEVHKLYPAMLNILDGISPQVASFIESTSTVQVLAARRP